MTALTKTQFNDLFRYCGDIGMFANDRPINDTENHEGSCVHRTDYCDVTCYNVKLYKMYPDMAKRDDRCEAIWQTINRVNAVSIREHFKRKRKQTKRVRHMTRGEAIKDAADVYRVRDIALANPDTIWWMPTRAWRNPLLKLMIEQDLMTLPNMAVNASLDPSNTDDEWNMLKRDGWNIMFYGDDSVTHDPDGERLFDCPKTGKGLKGHCGICKGGCFSQTTIGKRKTVLLHQH